jgi:hypothetical protein
MTPADSIDCPGSLGSSPKVLRASAVLGLSLLCSCGPTFESRGGTGADRAHAVRAFSDQSFQSQEADLGIIPVGATRDHVFVIRNSSNLPWKLRNISTNCSCTVASADRAIVRPGQSVRITLRYHAPEEATEFRKVSTASFEPPAGPTIDLVLRGKVRSPLSLSSHLISFETLAGTVVSSKRLTIWNHSDHDFRDLRCEVTVAWVHASVAPQTLAARSEGARQAWTIEVQPSTRQLESGFHRTAIRLSEADPRPGSSPQVKTIAVTVCVEPRIAVTPTSLLFGAGPHVGTVEKELEVHLPREPTPGKEVTVDILGHLTLENFDPLDFSRILDAPV